LPEIAKMIVVTGAAGFIGSALIAHLLEEGYTDIVAVDDFSRADKNANLLNKKLRERVHRDDFFSWIDQNEQFIQLIFHLGARTDTTEFDRSIFDRLNLNYSKEVWKKCIDYALPLVYASSAATYGLGEFGYEDKDDLALKLKPLNPYGVSKNDFDKWILNQPRKPFFYAGIKFFNVYGPNEYHKGRMASVVYHTHRQIGETGKMKLFQSHNRDFANGEQKRDFVYIKDVVKVLQFMMEERKVCGLFNLGTGEARTFNDLATSTFRAMNIEPKIEYIPTPEDIRDKYQYFTQAEMQKLRSAGYSQPFTGLEEGIEEYVKEYLQTARYY
jgi:ADP-L-glycero-D-manno-heptose 6-epimerase